MRRDEIYANGAVIAADVYDLTAGTYTREEGGQVVSTRPLTDDEVAALTPPPPPPPSAEERLAAALAAIEAPMTVTDVIEAMIAALSTEEPV